MNKLTTERLEQYAHDKHMCNINDEIREMAQKLLAYEQAAKNEVALPEALKYAEIYGRAFICVDRSGSVHAVDPSQIALTILNEPAPVLPKQPEPENKIAQIKRQKALAWLKRVAYENPCMKEVKTCIEVLSAPTQPVITEQDEREKRVLKLINDNNLSWEILFSELEEAKGRINRLYKLPDDLDFDCEFENGDYGSDEEPWLRGRVAGFNEALKVIKRSHNAEKKSTAQPVSEPYKLEIDMDDADHFSITHLHEIIYGKELIWPEAKLLARFMLDVKQRVSASPAQECE